MHNCRLSSFSVETSHRRGITELFQTIGVLELLKVLVVDTLFVPSMIFCIKERLAVPFRASHR